MIAFFKKELTEALRTHKLTVLGLVFLLFGIMSPAAAKFLPQILASAMPEGMNFTLPEPSAMDSWAQFFKNVNQMGLIVVVILLSGMMANELSRGDDHPVAGEGAFPARGDRREVFVCEPSLDCRISILLRRDAFVHTVLLAGRQRAQSGRRARRTLGIRGASDRGAALWRGAVQKQLWLPSVCRRVRVALFFGNLVPAVKEVSPLVLTSGTGIMTASSDPSVSARSGDRLRGVDRGVPDRRNGGL